MNPKPWYLSRTLWVNVIACAAILVQWGTDAQWFDLKAQVAILAILNVALRSITNQAIRG